jgi:hypothetical protein
MLKFQLTRTIGYVLVTLLALCLVVVGLRSSGPDLVNYQAFEVGDLSGHFAVQLHTRILSFLGVGTLYGTEYVVTVIYFLLSVKICRHAHAPLLSILLFTLVFLFSYESVSMYGNILRQGFSVFLVLMIYPMGNIKEISFLRLFMLLFSGLIHPSALVALFWIFILDSRVSMPFSILKSRVNWFAFAALLMFAFFFKDYVLSRLQLLNHRDLISDFMGYAYSLFLFICSLILIKLSGRSYRWALSWFLIFFLSTIAFGEFGQRVLMGLSFVSIFYILSYNRLSPLSITIILMSVSTSSLVMFLKNSYFFEVLS